MCWAKDLCEPQKINNNVQCSYNSLKQGCYLNETSKIPLIFAHLFLKICKMKTNFINTYTYRRSHSNWSNFAFCFKRASKTHKTGAQTHLPLAHIHTHMYIFVLYCLFWKTKTETNASRRTHIRHVYIRLHCVWAYISCVCVPVTCMCYAYIK